MASTVWPSESDSTQFVLLFAAAVFLLNLFFTVFLTLKAVPINVCTTSFNCITLIIVSAIGVYKAFCSSN